MLSIFQEMIQKATVIASSTVDKGAPQSSANTSTSAPTSATTKADSSATLSSLFEKQEGSMDSGGLFGMGGLLGMRGGIPKMPSFRVRRQEVRGHPISNIYLKLFFFHQNRNDYFEGLFKNYFH